MIALAIHDYMVNGVPHNSHDRTAIASRSMTHDIFEILSGDLDSIFKIALESRYPGAYQTVIDELATHRPVSSELYTAVAGEERAAKGTIVEAIVKLADFVEALLFIQVYGTNNAHTQWTRDDILEKMWQKLEEYKKAHALQRYDWERVEDFLNLVLNRPGLDEKARRGIDEAIA
jgi:5'-deoxynucleotidase YfbR-like HD superfamily hydrolase